MSLFERAYSAMRAVRVIAMGEEMGHNDDRAECNACGTILPGDEAIRYGGRWLCEDCAFCYEASVALGKTTSVEAFVQLGHRYFRAGRSIDGGRRATRSPVKSFGPGFPISRSAHRWFPMAK